MRREETGLEDMIGSHRFPAPRRRAPTLALCAAGAAVLFVACSGSSPKPVPRTDSLGTATVVAATTTPDPRPRPAGVPAQAQQLRAAAQYGDPASTDAATPKLTSIACSAGLMTITTTTAVFYAELPCDRALPDSSVQPFVSNPLRVRVQIATASKLYLDSKAGGTAEFTVGRIWLQPN
ncbi:MAG: hypothetical protein IVW36_06445 [Dehalococcoidia bacterium]|nr:hypothetical protein [Dehalococcoidia bacterium]